MRDYIERAKDFIEQIFPYLEDSMDLNGIDDAIDAFNADYDRKVIYRHGLSRIALITSDYVVKFDFDPYEIDEIGGCENELELYAWAKREGFTHLLAEITPIVSVSRCSTSCPASVVSVAVTTMPNII